MSWRSGRLAVFGHSAWAWTRGPWGPHFGLKFGQVLASERFAMVLCPVVLFEKAVAVHVLVPDGLRIPRHMDALHVK